IASDRSIDRYLDGGTTRVSFELGNRNLAARTDRARSWLRLSSYPRKTCLVYPMSSKKVMGFLPAFAKTRVSVTFATILAMSSLYSCSPNQNKGTAELAVLDFHQRLISAQYHEIYATSDPEFQHAMSESDATALFTAVNTKLGHPKSSELRGWRVNLLVNGTFVTLVYQTEFAQAGAQEEFVWRVKG